MKKRILAAALCAAMTMSLTGCGKEETSAPANTGNSTVNTGTSTPTSTPSTTSTAQTESSAPQSTSSATEESKPEESSAPELPASNEDDFDWGYNNDGTVSIFEYYGSDENVVIPSTLGGKPVTQISEEAFYGNIDITSVTIPASVEYIGGSGSMWGGAFEGCINLNEVNFLGDTPEFTLLSFEGTPWLEKKLEENKDADLIIDNALVLADVNISGDVVVPEGVTCICPYAFSNGNLNIKEACREMTSITIPDSVTDIGMDAFAGCEKLENIKLPKNITVIKRGTFYGCVSLKSIDIPNGVTTIGEVAFSECTADINLPDTVTTLDKYAFNGFYGTVTFNGKTYSASETEKELVAAIEQHAIENEFGGKDFIVTGNVLEKVNPTATKIELPDSVTGIADNAFKDCDRSIIITFKGKNYNYDNLAKLKEAVNGN